MTETSLRCWAIAPRRGRCRRCRQAIVWVIDDKGIYRPFRPEAKRLRTEQDERGRTWAFYAPDAWHKCAPAKGSKSSLPGA